MIVFSWTHVEYPCHNSSRRYTIPSTYKNKKENKIKCRKPNSSLNFETSSSVNSDNNICSPGSVRCDSSNNKKTNDKRDSSIDYHRGQKSTLPKKYRQLEMELYRTTGSKRKTRTPKRISSSSTKMEQKNETINFKSKRTNSKFFSQSDIFF
jgi:hypothetical protein